MVVHKKGVWHYCNFTFDSKHRIPARQDTRAQLLNTALYYQNVHPKGPLG